MLSNAYFLAKFRFDTAENEPAKNLQNFRKMHFRKCIFEKCIFEKCIFRKCIFRNRLGAAAPRERLRGDPGDCLRLSAGVDLNPQRAMNSERSETKSRLSIPIFSARFGKILISEYFLLKKHSLSFVSYVLPCSNTGVYNNVSSPAGIFSHLVNL